jgi:hypothetical protein
LAAALRPRDNPLVSRPRLLLESHFPANYQLEQLDRIDRSDGRKAYGFPGADAIDLQQDPATGPILAVTPDAGDPWVGVFHGGDPRVPPAVTARLIAWPDTRSFCVVYKGGGVVVRADDPRQTYEIDTYLITGVFVAPRHRVVVFADHTDLTAYNGDGLLWRSGRLALDEVRVEGVDGDSFIVHGFFGSKSDRFSADIAMAGRPAGHGGRNNAYADLRSPFVPRRIS